MWEYQAVILPPKATGGITDMLNSFGVQGWRLVAVDSGVAFFEKQKPSFPSFRIGYKKEDGTEVVREYPLQK